MNRESIIKQCKKEKACRDEFDKLVAAETDERFNQILADNVIWLAQKRIDIDYEKILPLSNLDGAYWSLLLSHRPHLYKYCEWEKLYDYDWTSLLDYQPQFSKYRV